MKKLNFFLATLALVFSLVSCTTTNKSVSSVPVVLRSSPAPLEVDYTVDINKKLQGSSKSTYILGFLRIAGDNTYADGMSYSSQFASGQEGFMKLFGSFAQFKIVRTKASAAYNALSSSDADFIANPHYSIKQTKLLFGLIKSYEAEVTGWKGKYTKAYKGERDANYIILKDK